MFAVLDLFWKYYDMIVIGLSKQKVLDANPKSMQQINLTGNLYRDGNTTILFITGEAKETIFDFSQGTVKILWIYFPLM